MNLARINPNSTRKLLVQLRLVEAETKKLLSEVISKRFLHYSGNYFSLRDNPTHSESTHPETFVIKLQSNNYVIKEIDAQNKQIILDCPIEIQFGDQILMEKIFNVENLPEFNQYLKYRRDLCEKYLPTPDMEIRPNF